MEKTKWDEIQAVLLLAVAVLIFISFVSFDSTDLAFFTSRPNMPVHNFAGLFGVYLGAALFFVMGMSAYVLPLLVLSWAIARFSGITPQRLLFKLFGTFFLILAASSLFSIIGGSDNALRFTLGGILGLVFSDFLMTYLGSIGALVVIVVLFLLSALLATEFLLLPFLTGMMQRLRGIPDEISERIETRRSGGGPSLVSRRTAPATKKASMKEKGDEVKEQPRIRSTITGRAPVTAAAGQKEAVPAATVELPRTPPRIVIAPQPAPAAPRAASAPRAPVTVGDYHLPSVDLLDSPPPVEERKIKEDFDANAAVLEETLRDFDIEAKVVEINRGPVITRYELEPAPGVKIHRITSLSDNIALSMKAQSVRIVAPIPGKGTVGIEVPNSTSTLVYLKEVLLSKEYVDSSAKLKLALGKDIAGAPVIADLASMPHLLIAGATGSGKTVCINGVITSLLLTYSPDDVKFIMIDPKRVELAAFNDLPHLLAPVVTDTKKVASTLDWVVSEMDSRYELFAQTGVRNIDLYNQKMARETLSAEDTRPKKLPYVIVVIDELADLMMVAQQDVEGAITRLAQLSRAVGIHIILATQRPSVDVITGVIKANFPARISFKVASKVDSRTVLDINGADKLLGRGDMLFVEPGASKPVRAQCSLIADREIEKITSFIRSQRGPQYIEEILEEQKKPNFKKFEKDEVYGEAVKVILESGQASVSMLQRRLGLGYTRAARLIDMMEDEGVVGPYQGSKPRDILMTLEEYQAKNG